MRELGIKKAEEEENSFDDDDEPELPREEKTQTLEEDLEQEIKELEQDLYKSA